MFRRLWREDRGDINFVKIGLVLAGAAVLYFGWIYVPVYVDHYFGVRRVVHTAANVAYAHRADQPVRESLLHGIAALHMTDQHVSADGKTVTTVPTPFGDDNITALDIEESPPQITLSIHYTRTVVWPFVKKEHVVEFNYSHTEDLSVIKY